MCKCDRLSIRVRRIMKDLSKPNKCKISSFFLADKAFVIMHFVYIYCIFISVKCFHSLFVYMFVDLRAFNALFSLSFSILRSRHVVSIFFSDRGRGGGVIVTNGLNQLYSYATFCLAFVQIKFKSQLQLMNPPMIVCGLSTDYLLHSHGLVAHHLQC